MVGVLPVPATSAATTSIAHADAPARSGRGAISARRADGCSTQPDTPRKRPRSTPSARRMSRGPSSRTEPHSDGVAEFVVQQHLTSHSDASLLAPRRRPRCSPCPSSRAVSCFRKPPVRANAPAARASDDARAAAVCRHASRRHAYRESRARTGARAERSVQRTAVAEAVGGFQPHTGGRYGGTGMSLGAAARRASSSSIASSRTHRPKRPACAKAIT